MTSMNGLEKEILNYEKKGFEKVQGKTKTLKFGSRVFLRKKKYLGLEVKGVYMYFVDGTVSSDSIHEFLRDYEKLYREDESYDKNALFICSENCDKKQLKQFRDYSKDIIRKENIRNTIKLISPNKSKETKNEPLTKMIEKKAPDKEDETETSLIKESKERKTETSNVEEIIAKINKFQPFRKPKNEQALEDMLLNYLSPFYSIHPKTTYESATIDATIGKIGIELKYQPNSGAFDRLYGQVDKYLKHLDAIIVVIGYEKTNQGIITFENRMKERGWLNNRIFLISIK